MTTIRAKCPSCGDVGMAANEMSLHLHPSGDRGAYRFTCPECREEVNKPASRKTVAVLIAAGVETASRIEEEVARPELPFEDRGPDPDAAAFTLDDVIAFHFELLDDEALAGAFALEG
jgi:hypothetical protein